MRVCIYSHAFLPSVGGVQAHSARLAASLAGGGVDVVVVTRTPADGVQDDRLPYRVQRQPSLDDLAREVAASDVVHLNTWSVPVVLAARLLRKPLLWFHHDYDTICPKSIAWNGYRCHFQPVACARCLARDHTWRAIGRRYAAFAVRRALRRLVQSHAAHTPFVAWRLGLPDPLLLGAGTSIGPHPRPLTPGPSPRGRGESCLREEGMKDREAGALFAGRLIAEKGVDVLLRALRRCRDAGASLHVTIVGDGPEREPLQRLADALGLSEYVSFRGEAPPDEMVALMRQALCLVLPSVWDEPTGYTPLEAMGLGVPVIAARVGGLAALVGHNSLLFERGDDRGLARQLLALMARPALQRRLARAGTHQTQSHHNWQALAGDYLAAYQALSSPAQAH